VGGEGLDTTRHPSLLHFSLTTPVLTAKWEASEEVAHEKYSPASRLPLGAGWQSGGSLHKTLQFLKGRQYSQLDYIPREYLSFVPKPLAEIEIPFPDNLTGDVSVSVQLEVFIDENGVVTKVQLNSSHISAAVDDAAVNAFLNARFKPGEIEGQVVRSLLRVEVTFESHSSDSTSRIQKHFLAL
jgi:TonB family protein